MYPGDHTVLHRELKLNSKISIGQYKKKLNSPVAQLNSTKFLLFSLLLEKIMENISFDAFWILKFMASRNSKVQNNKHLKNFYQNIM